jgi:hypothetical protein
MLDPENYVARLRSLAQILANRRDSGVPVVLGEALGADPNSVEFFRRVVLFVELPKLARKQVDELMGHDSQDLYAQAIDEIANILENLDMRENWNNYISAFSYRTLTLLETCERAVTQRLTVKPLGEEVLAGLLRDIQEAIQEVLDAEMETEVKQLLLEMLREVEGALLAYKISGLAGLRRAVERTLGAVVLHHELLEKSKAPGPIKRTFKALGAVLTTLRNIDFIAQLPEKVQDYLKLGE